MSCSYRKYSPAEAIRRHELGLTDRIDVQEFIRQREAGENCFFTVDLSGANLSGITMEYGSSFYGSGSPGQTGR